MEDHAQFDYEFIDSRSELKQIARAMEKEKIIAVDVEADSMYHFREKVCLVQLSAGDLTVVIDALKIQDLSTLTTLFKRRNIQKVFHGADYDIRSLYRDFKISINNLFDTQLASRFLGFAETGLDAVIKQKYAVILDKRYQRKDWSRRPLPEDMIAYAAKDVGYLIPLARSLEAELKRKGRLGWVHEECEHLCKVRPTNTDTDPLFLKFKGAGNLNPRSLAVLEALLQYRKEIAQKNDKPLFRIISNKSLLILTGAKPLNSDQLEKTKALSPQQIKLHGEKVLAAINGAMQIAENSLPRYPRKRAPLLSAKVATYVKALRKWRDRRTRELKIDPSLICTKALMVAIAVKKPLNLDSLAKIEGLKNWQYREFGEEIVKVLRQAG